MMDQVLGDYARNVPDARESEVLSLFATIINKYVTFLYQPVLLIQDVWSALVRIFLVIIMY